MSSKLKTAPKNALIHEKPSWFDRLSESKKNSFCISIMAVIILILFWNIFFHGMIFAVSGDAAAFNAWKQAMEQIRTSENRDDVFWIPQVFTGMPIFGTLLLPKDVNYIEKFLLRIPVETLVSNHGEVRDVIHIFLGGLFMFLLCRSLQFSHLVSLLAAIVLMLNPYAIGALEAHQGKSIFNIDLRRPLLCIMGGEDQGVRQKLKDKCDLVARIPIFENVNSISVAAAAAVILSEISRQNPVYRQ